MARKLLSKHFKIVLYALCSIGLFIMAYAEFMGNSYAGSFFSMAFGMEGISIILKDMKKLKPARVFDFLFIISMMASNYFYCSFKTFIIIVAIVVSVLLVFALILKFLERYESGTVRDESDEEIIDIREVNPFTDDDFSNFDDEDELADVELIEIDMTDFLRRDGSKPKK